MFRNCLAAALRHLARNRLYTTISVLGLAIGLCTALIAALVIHNQYSYDHSVRGYERTYIVQLALTPAGRAKQYVKYTAPQVGKQVQLQLHDVEATSRVLEDDGRVQHGVQTWRTTVYWADPNLTDALPMATYAGDLAAALRTPDSVALSRSDARRFFGRDAPLGEILDVDGHAMVVRAVFPDQAGTTHLQRDIIAAGVSSYSPNSTAGNDALDKYGQLLVVPGMTYLRLRPGADLLRVQSSLQRLLQPGNLAKSPFAMAPELIRVDRFNTKEGLHPGFRNRMLLLGIMGVVVLLIAAVNFVNLQTARSALRAREAAIRAVAGAGRRTLIVQFLGEALLYAGAAALLAVALTEWLLPQVNTFLDAGAVLDYGREPWLVAMLLGATLLLAVLAGAWPAFVQSGIRPVNVLRGGIAASSGAAVRQGLTALQFALLIALGICAGIGYRQREFGIHEALRLDTDQVLMISAPATVPHRAAFVNALRVLPGVKAVMWGSVPFLGNTGFKGLRRRLLTVAPVRPAGQIVLDAVDVDFGLFGFYGIKPLAGRLASSDPTSVVLNATAARRFGLNPPAQAIGKSVTLPPLGKPGIVGDFVDSRVLAVVPDFSLDSVVASVPATIYIQPRNNAALDLDKLDLINVRLSGHDIPDTLAAIDSLWRHTDNADPINRFFLDEHIELLYQSVLRQSQAFGICALIALGLSCIGLFALTAAAAERRTKEIGIRKALGADTLDVLKLLLWQFSKPVIWASLIAWPVAAYVMRRWLATFAYHIDLPLWMFPTAALMALVIALLTVCTHSVLVARAKPVAALRYE
ncbi:MAG TPA: FtsX-like permease family protein [Steroidobacteraceae bacterium]